MTTYFDGRGNPVMLGTQLGSGGEGAVFALADDDKYVAKIYHQAVSSEKADKLRAMVELAAPELTTFASWPVGTIHKGRRGALAGILLPRVCGHVPVQNLYSPAHRKVKYPDKDWSFLLHVALNCAVAFDAIHRRSHVIGDVNQGNLLVSSQGTVYLIDCDSFQVRAKNHVFLCEVGVAHFTPPELQGQSFRGIGRTANHDNFGLAVILFHLLFLGRHPFAGRDAGRGEMPIERAIQEFRFAFSRNASSLQMAPPPNTPQIEQVTPSLASLFERTFARGSERPGARPSAKQWFTALYGLRTQLRNCPADEGHRYINSLSVCPWCEMMKQHGLNFFASVTVCRLAAEAFRITPAIEQAWKQIEAIEPPPKDFPESQMQTVPSATAAPLPPQVEVARLLCTTLRLAVWVSLALAVLTLPLRGALYFTIPLCAAFAGARLILTRFTSFGKEALRTYRQVQAHRSALSAMKREWKSLAIHYRTQFEVTKLPLANAYEEIQTLRSAYDAEHAKLEQDKVNRQRIRYLQSIFLSASGLEGVSEGVMAMLASYGLETAYDIDDKQLRRLPNFSRGVVEKLVAWRREMEAKFRYDAARGLPEADLQDFARAYVRKRAQLQRTLAAGVGELQQVVRAAKAALTEIERRYQKEKAAGPQP